MFDEPSAEVQARELAEKRERDLARQREKEEQMRKLEAERLEAEQKAEEERRRRIEEEKRKKKLEEEWKKLGSDVIQNLPPIPASIVDDKDPNSLKAWYLDDETSKAAYRTSSLKPGRKLDSPPVKLSQLRELGIIYYRINLNDFSIVNQIVKERQYKHTDEIKISQTCKDEQFLEKWFAEHCNEDEQVRLITDGTCYLDVRSKQDTWIRMHLQPGDLIVIAAGLYHRGTLDEDDYCAMFRIFRDAQRWAPLYRSEKRTETQSSRVQYLKTLKKGNVATDLGFK